MLIDNVSLMVYNFKFKNCFNRINVCKWCDWESKICKMIGNCLGGVLFLFLYFNYISNVVSWFVKKGDGTNLVFGLLESKVGICSKYCLMVIFYVVYIGCWWVGGNFGDDIGV